MQDSRAGQGRDGAVDSVQDSRPEPLRDVPQFCVTCSVQKAPWLLRTWKDGDSSAQARHERARGGLFMGVLAVLEAKEMK